MENEVAGIFDKTVAQHEDPDLLPMESVLVSTGQNLNDDVFVKEELWKARATPILKPVNWEHNSGFEIDDPDEKRVVKDNQIIGVTCDYYVMDNDGNIIDESKVANASDLPDKFHIVNKDLIWKYLFPKASAKLLKASKNKKLFVSMEAWFRDYDYLVGSKIIARNEETAFLDKFLRCNGGDGYFKESKVGRVLKDFVFGGKGIVKSPANKDSVIISVGAEEKVLAENTVGVINQNTEESNKMDELEKLKKELAELKSKLGEHEGKAAALKLVCEKATSSVADLVSEDNKKKLAAAAIDEYISIFVDVLRETVTVSHTVVESLKKEMASLKEELDGAKQTIAKVEAEKKLSERMSKVDVELGLASLSDDSEEVKASKTAEREKISQLVAGLSDEGFDTFVTATKNILKLNAPVAAKAQCDDEHMETEEEEEEAEDKTSASAEEAPAKTEASTAILDAVKDVETISAGRGSPAPAKSIKSMQSLASKLLGINTEEGK